MCWQQPRLKETTNWELTTKRQVLSNLWQRPWPWVRPLHIPRSSYETITKGKRAQPNLYAEPTLRSVCSHRPIFLGGPRTGCGPSHRTGLSAVKLYYRTEPLGGPALKAQHKDAQRFTPTKKPVFSWNTYFTTLGLLSPFAVLLRSQVSEFWLRVTGEVTHKSYTEYSL